MQNYKKMSRNKGRMKSNKVEIACNRKKIEIKQLQEPILLRTYYVQHTINQPGRYLYFIYYPEDVTEVELKYVTPIK